MQRSHVQEEQRRKEEKRQVQNFQITSVDAHEEEKIQKKTKMEEFCSEIFGIKNEVLNEVVSNL